MIHKKRVTLKRQITLVSIVGYLVLSAALGGYSMFSISSYSRDLGKVNLRTFDTYVNQVSGLVEDTDAYLKNVFMDNRDYSNLVYNRSAVNKYLAVYNLKKMLKVQLNFNKNLAALFVIYDSGSSIYYCEQSVFTLNSKEYIKSLLKDRASGDAAIDEWIVTDGGDKSYLIKILGTSGVYMAAVVDYQGSITDISERNKENAQDLHWVYGANGDFYGEPDMTARVAKYYDTAAADSKYYIYSGTVGNTDLIAYMLTPKNRWIQPQISQIVIILITLGCCAMCIFSAVVLRRQITGPLKNLMDTMKRIRDGSMDVMAGGCAREDYAIEEFAQLNTTFNEMLEQIKTLRVKAYEDELEGQRIKLGYYQLQLKPHFYLNCLKSLYALTFKKKYDKVQNMIIEISRHLRYMFQDNRNLVMLSEELEFARNYVQLIRNYVSEEIVYTEDIQESARSVKVPPLIVQTFVENSYKYGFCSGKALDIRVKAVVLEGEDISYLDIQVADNGGGYGPELLKHFNDYESEPSMESHIGIDNLKSRLRLIYGSLAEWSFMDDGGALSEVMIPCGMISGDSPACSGVCNLERSVKE